MHTPFYSRLTLRVLCSFLLGLAVFSFAITYPLQAQLPIVQDDIVSYSIKDLVVSEGTNQYKAPTMQEQTLFAEVMGEMLKFNFLAAHQKALALGYQVTDFTDIPSQKKYYILEKSGQGLNFWGKYMINPLASRASLVIQSPHPKFDFNTGLQGAHIFREVGAVLFCVAGTHRCNDTSASPCAGTTTVCSLDQSSRPFRRSDHAHVTDGMFQITTQVAIANLVKPVIIQVHGFDKEVGDPDVIMSNGTQKAPIAPLIDYSLLIKQQLQMVDAMLSFKVAHLDLDWTKLTGTTNTQGRLINNSIDPCTKSANIPTGQFVHIEQAKIGLRDSPANWNKLTQAIAASIPAIVQPPQLSVTPSSLNLTPSAGVLPTVNVSSNTSWTATSNQSWLQLTTPSGTGNGQVNGSIQSNASTIARQAVITITAGGLQRTVIVSQAGAALAISQSKISIPNSGQRGVAIAVYSNIVWTASANQSWITLKRSSGFNTDSLTFDVAVNPDLSIRSSTITLLGLGQAQSLLVEQAAKVSMTSIKSIAQIDNVVIPHPVNEDFTLRYSVHQSGSVMLSVINTLGITILHKSLFYQESGQYDEHISVQHLPPGLYTIIIGTSDKIISVPFLIIR